jgi:hypothetical protein
MRRFLVPMIVAAAALAAPTAASAANPVAEFTIAPIDPTTDTRVTLTSTSTDEDNDITLLSWDLNGNGRFEREGSPGDVGTVRARFRIAGVFTITLQVTDATGGSSSVSHTITVTAPDPVTEPPPPEDPPPPPPPPSGHSPSPSPSTTSTVIVSPAARVAGSVSRGIAPARLLAPFPVVRIQGKVIRNGAAIRRFTVKAPAGARVRVTCRGRGCPKRTTLVKRARKATILRFSGVERRLRVGTVIEVYVNRKSRMGKYTRIVIKRNAAPARQDMCVLSMRRSPSSCPSS